MKHSKNNLIKYILIGCLLFGSGASFGQFTKGQKSISGNVQFSQVELENDFFFSFSGFAGSIPSTKISTLLINPSFGLFIKDNHQLVIGGWYGFSKNDVSSLVAISE